MGHWRRYLALGTDANVTVDWGIGTHVDGLLNADICKGIFPKYRAGVQVCRHKATDARKSLMQKKSHVSCSMDKHTDCLRVMYLLWGQALHIGGPKDVFEILIQFCDVGVDGNLC